MIPGPRRRASSVLCAPTRPPCHAGARRTVCLSIAGGYRASRPSETDILQVSFSMLAGLACPAGRVLGGAPSSRGPPRRIVRVAASTESLSTAPTHASGRRQTLVAGSALLGGLLLPGGDRSARAASNESIYDLSALMFDEEVGSMCGCHVKSQVAEAHLVVGGALLWHQQAAARLSLCCRWRCQSTAGKYCWSSTSPASDPCRTSTTRGPGRCELGCQTKLLKTLRHPASACTVPCVPCNHPLALLLPTGTTSTGPTGSTSPPSHATRCDAAHQAAASTCGCRHLPSPTFKSSVPPPSAVWRASARHLPGGAGVGMAEVWL